MIDNKICPYCSCVLVVAENQENSRSVEHLIPNTVLTRKRGNDEGDFYACRRCNSRKSKIDYVLGVVAKMQSRDATFASESLVTAILKKDGRVKPFKRMLSTVNETVDGGATMAIPISGIDLLAYMTFLAQGQYFKQHQTVLDMRRYVLLRHFYNKEVSATFEANYGERFGTNNFRDLEANLYTEVIASGESMIYCKNHKYMFTFHDYIVITVELKKRNRKNIAKAAALDTAVVEGFPAL